MNISAPFTCTPSPDGRLDKENRVYTFLENISVPIFGLDHDCADTMEICELIEGKLGADICKNLFLSNAQATSFYLLLMPGKKAFKTKFLSKQINSSRLSFGSAENLEKHLDILPGSVSVMGLMNDKENAVRLLIDKDLLQLPNIGVHPCVNTSTLKITTKDLTEKIIPALGKEFTVVDLPDPNKDIAE
ncbi:MAG: prolyl-tRNA synthetase associated domain-containing protein [Clostridia bacterium]|nr:prolyl-tRNA synthetase associated domain-containing protein [Clostridia bacterium]